MLAGREWRGGEHRIGGHGTVEIVRHVAAARDQRVGAGGIRATADSAYSEVVAAAQRRRVIDFLEKDTGRGTAVGDLGAAGGHQAQLRIKDGAGIAGHEATQVEVVALSCRQFDFEPVLVAGEVDARTPAGAGQTDHLRRGVERGAARHRRGSADEAVIVVENGGISCGGNQCHGRVVVENDTEAFVHFVKVARIAVVVGRDVDSKRGHSLVGGKGDFAIPCLVACAVVAVAAPAGDAAVAVVSFGDGKLPVYGSGRAKACAGTGDGEQEGSRADRAGGHSLAGDGAAFGLEGSLRSDAVAESTGEGSIVILDDDVLGGCGCRTAIEGRTTGGDETEGETFAVLVDDVVRRGQRDSRQRDTGGKGDRSSRSRAGTGKVSRYSVVGSHAPVIGILTRAEGRRLYLPIHRGVVAQVAGSRDGHGIGAAFRYCARTRDEKVQRAVVIADHGIGVIVAGLQHRRAEAARTLRVEQVDTEGLVAFGFDIAEHAHGDDLLRLARGEADGARQRTGEVGPGCRGGVDGVKGRGAQRHAAERPFHRTGVIRLAETIDRVVGDLLAGVGFVDVVGECLDTVGRCREGVVVEIVVVGAPVHSRAAADRQVVVVRGRTAKRGRNVHPDFAALRGDFTKEVALNESAAAVVEVKTYRAAPAHEREAEAVVFPIFEMHAQPVLIADLVDLAHHVGGEEVGHDVAVGINPARIVVVARTAHQSVFAVVGDGARDGNVVAAGSRRGDAEDLDAEGRIEFAGREACRAGGTGQSAGAAGAVELDGGQGFAADEELVGRPGRQFDLRPVLVAGDIDAEARTLEGRADGHGRRGDHRAADRGAGGANHEVVVFLDGDVLPVVRHERHCAVGE